MLNPIRLGISGLGSAATLMIRAAAKDPRIVLAAAADPLPRPRESFARDFGARGYEDFDDLCGDPTIEAIYIASPHEYHAAQAIRAMEHGKDIIVEKPLALMLADCDEVIRTAVRTTKQVIVGHTHAFDPSIIKIQELARSGVYGRLSMILSFNYTDFLYRPRRAEELVTALGGGIVFNQISHQVDMARAVAGGPVRTVKANVGILDLSRPTEGNSAIFLEFESGVSASLIYSGYDFFDSDELHDWVAESGLPKAADAHGRSRRALMSDPTPEAERRQRIGYGSRVFPGGTPRPPHFGFFVATFEKADIRVTPDGLAVFTTEGRDDIALTSDSNMPGHRNVLEALWNATRKGQPCVHDAKWGKASLEILLATLTSARDRREVYVGHQPRDAMVSPLSELVQQA
jgi:phthalate 4,5-cis-dihydrodiol dehydrogenase